MKAYPPTPAIVPSKCSDKIADQHQDEVRNHRRQSHLWLSDAIVSLCKFHADPVTERPSRERSYDGSYEDSKIEKPDDQWLEPIGRRSECLSLRQIDSQETRGAPGDDERSKMNDWKGEELPWNPEVKCNAFKGVRVGLEKSELLLARLALTEPWISMRGSCMRKICVLSRDQLIHIFETAFGLQIDLFVRRLHGRFGFGVSELVRVGSMPFSLWKAKETQEEGGANYADVEPCIKQGVSSKLDLSNDVELEALTTRNYANPCHQHQHIQPSAQRL